MSSVTDRLPGYQLQLPTFEGPLDVLLQLIERSQLDISDVSLVTITTGFIDYVTAMVDPEPALLAQFLGVASRLLLLKSRAMLPRSPVEASDPDPDDLVEQLREYQRAKQFSEVLLQRAQSGVRSFGRPLLPTNGAANIVVVAPPVSHLRRALMSAVARVRAEPQVAQLRLQVTIGEMIERLRARMRVFREMRFIDSLQTTTREELVAGFIALLALWRIGEVIIHQESHESDIWVERSTTDPRPT